MYAATTVTYRQFAAQMAATRCPWWHTATTTSARDDLYRIVAPVLTHRSLPGWCGFVAGSDDWEDATDCLELAVANEELVADMSGD